MNPLDYEAYCRHWFATHPDHDPTFFEIKPIMPRPSIIFISDLPMPQDELPSNGWAIRVHGVPELRNPWIKLSDIGLGAVVWTDMVTACATDAFTSVPGARLPCFLSFDVRHPCGGTDREVHVYLLPGLREYLSSAP